MGTFNSDDRCVYYCGKNPIEGMEKPSKSARVQNAVLGCNLKNDRMILVHFQSKPFSIMEFKSVLQPLMPTKLKLNGSMKTYKTF